MNKSQLLLSCLALSLSLTCAPVLAAAPSDTVTVQVGQSIVPTPPGIHLANGQVMVPIRWAAEQLGARSIQWDEATQTVTITTNEAYYQKLKLDSFVYNGLQPRSAEREAQMWPLPEKAKSISLPQFPRRELQLNPEVPNSGRGMTITINNSPSLIYNAETINDHIYVPMDWIEALFKTEVQYDQAANKLTIKALNQAEIEQQIKTIEDALIPDSPQAAMKLWGRGEQTRSAALQYAALSPELRKQADARLRDTFWVTGFSSPWVGAITVEAEQQRSDTAVEYTVSFPEITSAGQPYTTAMEKFVVEKLTVDGKEGWYITEMLQGSPYGILAEED
ncbi:copper amine oxidase N-terminal domain-containing protein [Brevibacillus sp. B_LB10_24]|uniref:copper amine oxidase N-terminal domain-containing protein n=1 Tax=Brevibacillus sp. B_LB10_24 TaxID=3380645 RepID=UPI0038BA14F3